MVQLTDEEVAVTEWARRLVSELWRNQSTAIDFSYELHKEIINAPGRNSALRLAEELLHAAGSIHQFYTVSLDCLQLLVHSEYLTWANYLNVISLYTRFDNRNCVFHLCQTLEEQLPCIECNLTQEGCNQLRDAVIEVLKWFLKGLEFCFHDELRMHQETGRRMLLTVCHFAQDPFISRLLSIASQQMPELSTAISHLIQNAEDSEYLEPAEIEAIESLGVQLDNCFKPLKFTIPDVIFGGYKLRRSSIRSLVSVYACFRVLAPASEIADTMYVFAQLHKIPFEDAVFDMIHSTLMIQIQEKELKLEAKFRWQVFIFMFLKLPDVLQQLILKGVTSETIERALSRIVNEYKSLLDDIDFETHCNSFKCLIMELVHKKAIDEEVAGRLNSRRDDQLLASQESRLNLLTRDMFRPNSEYNTMKLARDTNEMVLNNLSQKLYQSYLKMFQSLTGSGGMAFEAMCALYGRDATLGHFTNRLASASLMLQNKIKFQNRHKIFDFTFIMLTKVAMMYDMLTFDEIVNGFGGGISQADNRGCIFYTWAVKYFKRITPPPTSEQTVAKDFAEQPQTSSAAEIKMEIDEAGSSNEEKDNDNNNPEDEQMDIDEKGKDKEEKEEEADERTKAETKEYKDKADRWKQGTGFWLTDDADFGATINQLPSIAVHIFNDYKTKEHRLNLDEMRNIINSMRNATCLLVCLIQWLDCQPNCEPKRIMAKQIIACLEEIKPEELEDQRIRFVTLMCKPILEEMIETQVVVSPITNALMIIAKRGVPKMRRNQVPDQDMLRRAWFGLQRQNWASPYILRMLEFTNRAKAHKEWIHFFVHNMLKLNCTDMIAKMIELLCACTMLDPAGTLVRILETLIESMIKENPGAHDYMLFGNPYVMPLVSLLTHVMLMSVWITHKGKKMAQRTNNDETTSASKSDEEKPDWEVLMECVEVTINRFAKLAQNGVMTLRVCVVCHTLREIAASPDSEPKRLLTKMIPHKMLFQLARITPAAMPVELFANFCDSEESLDEQLLYLCNLKKYGGF